jgi:hypothetical protein
MAKRSNRQTLLLPDVLWNELAIVAAQARKNRARFIREVLTAAVHGPSLTSVRASPPPKVAQMPSPIAIAAAPFRTPDLPPPPPNPKIEDYETDDERFERERNELDPDALYARQLSRGETPEAAREQVKDWCSQYDVHEDWEPASDEEIH